LTLPRKAGTKKSQQTKSIFDSEPGRNGKGKKKEVKGKDWKKRKKKKKKKMDKP